MTNTITNGKSIMRFQLWRTVNGQPYKPVCMLANNRKACDNNELVLPRGVRP